VFGCRSIIGRTRCTRRNFGVHGDRSFDPVLGYRYQTVRYYRNTCRAGSSACLGQDLTIGCTATGFPLLRSSKPAREPGVRLLNAIKTAEYPIKEAMPHMFKAYASMHSSSQNYRKTGLRRKLAYLGIFSIPCYLVCIRWLKVPRWLD